MSLLARLVALSFAASVGVFGAGCVVANGEGVDGEGDDEEFESEPDDDERAAEAASVGVDCSAKRTDTGYKSGKGYTITVVKADGKPIEIATASMYARMQKAAAASGVAIRVVSGFRTNAEQKYLYNCYLTKSCNGGNLAARPGYSNHQSGHALDLNSKGPGVMTWLNNNASKYGFKRTVPSEPWHWEYWGGMVDGGCGGATAAPPPSSGCTSATLGRTVPLNTCVQSKFDRKWYQCLPGNDWEIRWNVPAACVSEHPL